MWSLKGIGMTDVPTCCYSLSGYRPPACAWTLAKALPQGRRSGPRRISHSIRAEEGAVEGSLHCGSLSVARDFSWAVVSRGKGEEAPMINFRILGDENMRLAAPNPDPRVQRPSRPNVRS